MTIKDEFNNAAEEQQAAGKRKPDSIVYYEKPGKGSEKELVRFGAAWRHSKGDGLSVQLDHGGRFVIFPNKPK